MSPVIDTSRCCSVALPYWDWELEFDTNKQDTYVPLSNSALWDPPELLGDGTSEPGTYYVDSGYFRGTDWLTTYKTSSSITGYQNPGPNYDNQLKRLMNATHLSLNEESLIRSISTTPNFKEFMIYIHGTAHNLAHNCFHFSMKTASSPDDPLFFFHHANVDRIAAIWVDCHYYENIPKTSLTNDCPQYFSKNPLSGTQVKGYNAPGGVFVPYQPELDAQLTFYYSSSSVCRYITTGDFPTIRDMWSFGSSTTPGWNSLYYRYGPDALVQKYKTQYCLNGGQWTLVNYGA